MDLGFGKTEPVQIAEGAFTPRKVLAKLIEQFPAKPVDPNDREVVRVDVAGLKAGAKKLIRMEATVFSDNTRQLSCGALDTGVPPSIVAQMIANNQIKETGVLAPELCVPEEEFFAELRKRAIDVKTLADPVCVLINAIEKILIVVQLQSPALSLGQLVQIQFVTCHVTRDKPFAPIPNHIGCQVLSRLTQPGPHVSAPI